MNLYRIIIADDDALFREGFKRILLEAGNLKVIGEVADGKSSKEVASLLYITIRTVEHRRANIMIN
jgi:DNA-binding NarL/FixJ family response regulator